MSRLGQHASKTGGVTFATVCVTGVLATTVFTAELDWLMAFLVKACTVTAQLAWYWISANDDIREATDSMFRAGLRRVLGVWSTRVAPGTTDTSPDDQDLHFRTKPEPDCPRQAT